METRSHGPALQPVPDATEPLKRIVCGVDGSRSAYEAVRQAAELAGATAQLDLVAVSDETGFGANAEATLTSIHAHMALERAAEMAKEAGVTATTACVHRDIAADALMEQADGADLIVVSNHRHSRLGGIMIGSTAAKLVHSADVPVLVTRPLEDRHLLDMVVIACGGPRGAAAVRFAERLALGRDARLTLLRVDGRGEHSESRELSAARVHLQAALGTEPPELLRSGSVPHEILRYAATDSATLLVLGSRALHGTHALRSTAERVAHEANCSVLIVRPSPEGV